MYTRIRKLSKWVTGGGRQFCHYWTGSLWVNNGGGKNEPVGTKLELETTV